MTAGRREAARNPRSHPLISDVIAVMDQLYPSTAADGLGRRRSGGWICAVPVTKIFFTVDVILDRG